MTKQEAIDILKADFGINIWQTPNGYSEADFYNAYDIAIECIAKCIGEEPKKYCKDCKYRRETDYRRIEDQIFYCAKHYVYVTKEGSCDK